MSLCVADADLAYEILLRCAGLRRNREERPMLNVYGKRLSTTNDQGWQQQGNVTAVTFTVKNNEQVGYQSLINHDSGALRSNLLAYAAQARLLRMVIRINPISRNGQDYCFDGSLVCTCVMACRRLPNIMQAEIGRKRGLPP
jgi:hypothetical protein